MILYVYSGKWKNIFNVLNYKIWLKYILNLKLLLVIRVKILENVNKS